MNDPQNEPRTCPYCDQPRQDTFDFQFRFACGTSLLKDSGKTVKQGRECKLRVAYSKLLVDYCNLKEGAPSQATIDAAMADGAIVEPGDAARLQRIRERLSDCLTAGGGDQQTAREWVIQFGEGGLLPNEARQLADMHDAQKARADRAEAERDTVRKLFAGSKRARQSLSDACDSLQAELRTLKAERDRLREVLECLCIAVAGAGVSHPKERALLQETYDMARAALNQTNKQ